RLGAAVNLACGTGEKRAFVWPLKARALYPFRLNFTFLNAAEPAESLVSQMGPGFIENLRISHQALKTAPRRAAHYHLLPTGLALYAPMRRMTSAEGESGNS